MQAYTKISRREIDELSYEVIGAAIEVHKEMGRGLLESVYHQCMLEELNQRNISHTSELKIPVCYKGKNLNVDFRCDLFVENCLVVELKAMNELLSGFEAQLLTYMKLLKAPKGILINFNSANIFQEGQKTLVNEFYRNLY